MNNLRGAYVVLVPAFLALVAAGPARAWCVDTPGVPGACDLVGPCNNRNTHERIALLAAQNGGNPNGGQEYSIISQWASTPDCQDTGWSHVLKHTSIAGSTSTWTSTNIASALLTGKWVCAKKVLGSCVWWRWDLDRPARARFIGRASHYLADGGQPYHDQVAQSVLYPPGNNFDTWLAIHLAFEAWADANGNTAVVTNAPTWFSTDPYSTASSVSASTRGLFTALGPLVDLCYNPATQTLTPSPAGICSNNFTRACTTNAQCGSGTCTSIAALLTGTIVNTSWSTIGSGLKGVYRWNTYSSLEPEMVNLYLDVVNNPATGYASTRTPGGQTRMDLARVRNLFMSSLMTPAELTAHADDVSWWDSGDTNRVLAHPGFADPQQTAPLTVINAVGSTSSPIMHPDLSVRFLAFSRVHPDPGQPLEVTAVVVNEGGAASPAIPVELRVDGQTVETVYLPPLDPLSAGAVSLMWTATAPGPHELVVTVDPSCNIDESGSAPDPQDPEVFIVVDNEDDNVQNHTIYVGLPPEPEASTVQRFDTNAGGTLQLPSGDLQLVLPPNYSAVSPYVSAAESDPTGSPFPGGTFLSKIYSLNPAGRAFNQDATLTLRFDNCAASAVGVYRFDEEGDAGWIPTGNNVVFNSQAGRVTFGTNTLGILAVIGTGVCDDANPCTIDTCTSGTCLHGFESAGFPCGDPTARVCDAPDTCDGNGSCLSNQAPNGAPGEVAALRFTGPLTDKQTIGWNPDPGSTVYGVLRGSLAQLPVGPGGGDETCLDDDLAGTSIVDPAVPNEGHGFWYLVRGKSTCGVGTYGHQRTSTTCQPYCGQGELCFVGQRCVNGICVCDPVSCGSGCCSGAICTTPSPLACGGGGGACVACGTGADTCVGGVCQCGSGAACGSGQRCVAGACVCDAASCPSGCCAGATCMTPSASACGIGGGACVTCGAGADSCVGGVCQCGSGAACGSGQRCVAGACVCDAASCPGGCCASATCMTPSTSACGIGGSACVTCSSNHVLSGSCTAGICTGTCVAGWGDCDGNMASNGCETNLNTDPNNCGSCAAACSSNHMSSRTCASGNCTGICVAGWGNCDGNLRSNGCETNLNADPNNCSFCTNVCGSGADSCVGGVCQCGSGAACGAGQRCASGACVCDATSCPSGCCAGATCMTPSASACGGGGGACVACGTGADSCVGGICQCGSSPACGAGQRCVAGACVCDAASCPSGCCAGSTCTSPTPSACGSGGAACVACGTGADSCVGGVCQCGSGAACGAGQRCVAGACVCDAASCPGGCCAGATCMTPSTSACGIGGGACVACSSNHVLSGSCTAGTCTGTCVAGWGNCDGNMGSNGCEANTNTDPDNCSSCGQVCSTNHVLSRTCTSGACTGTCEAGWGDCDGNMRSNGCETNVNTDPNNCGSCALYCSSNHVTNRTCTSGTCTGTCDAGWGDCDGNMASNGCETNTATDPGNCGICGLACSGGTVCEAGSCVCPPGVYFCASAAACIPNCAVCSGAGLACAVSRTCISSCKTSCAGMANCTATASCVAECPMCPPSVQTCTTPSNNLCVMVCNPSTCPGGSCH